MRFKKLRRFKKDVDYEIKHKINFDFTQKADGESDDVYIEGYANRAVMDDGKKVIDRGQEHIPSKEWSIDEWMKNPIIFLNHNRDMIIGKGVEAEIRKEGLWIKVQISNSKDKEISKVRDLIKEGILKTFSVGIDVKSEQVEEDGSLTLKGVNLLETSVVSIPMNQESFFEISTKSLKIHSVDKISFRILRAKGALVAAAIHNKISELLQADKEFSRAEILVKVASDAGVSATELFDILAGNTLSIDEDVLKSFSSNLTLDFDELKKLNKSDVNISDPDSELIPEDEEDVDEDLADDDEDEEDEEEKKKKEIDDKICELITKSLKDGEEQDAAISSVILDIKKDHDQTLSKRNWDVIFKTIEDFSKKEVSQEVNGLEATLQAALQTNLLLSQMIGKFDDLNKSIASLQPLMSDASQDEELELSDDEEDEDLLDDDKSDDTKNEDDLLADDKSDDEEEEDEEDSSKSLDIMSKYRADLRKKLNSFNKNK